MSGNYSRTLFDAHKGYSEVLMQQGKVQLDSCWNAQVFIDSYRTTSVYRDLLGPVAIPSNAPGFTISIEPAIQSVNEKSSLADRLKISEGRIYVQGNPIENFSETSFADQPYLPCARDELPCPSKGSERIYVIYLDSWQRCVTALEDPNLSDPALGGLDTTTRTQNVWQVKANSLTHGADPADISPFLPGSGWQPEGIPSREDYGKMQARTFNTINTELENNFYRIEVHQNASPRSLKPISPGEKTSVQAVQQLYKWSRNNASSTASVLHMDNISPDHTIQNDCLRGDLLVTIKQEDSLQFSPGAIVELTDDRLSFHQNPGILTTIKSVDECNLQLELKPDQINLWNQLYLDNPEYNENNRIGFNRRLIRWDGIGKITPKWHCLISADKTPEPIEIRFSDKDKPPRTNGSSPIESNNNADIAKQDKNCETQPRYGSGYFQSGDFWNFASRTLSADIDWPINHVEGEAVPLPESPHGPIHHYSCLTLMHQNSHGEFSLVESINLIPQVPLLTNLDNVDPNSKNGEVKYSTDKISKNYTEEIATTQKAISNIGNEVTSLSKKITTLTKDSSTDRIETLEKQIQGLKNDIADISASMKKHTELLMLVSKKEGLMDEPKEAHAENVAKGD